MHKKLKVVKVCREGQKMLENEKKKKKLKVIKKRKRTKKTKEGNL